ncbi:MAG: serine/threonine-protein kinase [Myxococcaceae bacterium]|nr:serine/threonine-protein kinase [Myxococcaceae bacterium]
MAHVDPQRWTALTERRLSAADEAEVRAHAIDCPECGPRLALIEQKRVSEADAPTRELSVSEASRAVELTKGAVLERGTSVGRFVLLDVLGVGGMGAVYSAYDPQLDRKVALKLLATVQGPDASASAHARMLREAQAMARLSHPNVVNVFEVGEHAGGIFIAMEYVPGTTLKAWLRATPRSWRDTVAVFLQAGRGLAAAHAAHLIHRDFKPANVLMGEDGRARVTDFGVARADGTIEPVGPGLRSDDSGKSAALAEPLTQHDVVVGTVGYMSPEQALAMNPDARSDQFSFCVSLWEALYGERPFAGVTPTEVTKALIDGRLPPRPKSSVPAWLHAVLERGLARQPEDRFATMEALLEALDRRPVEWTRFAPWAAAVVVALGGLAWQVTQRSRVVQACAAFADVSAVWGPEARREVTASFDAVKKPFAAAARASATRALDGWAEAFSEKAKASCEAARVRREVSPESWARQEACFGRRRAELVALVTALSKADDATAERAGTFAWSLTAPGVCTNLTRLRADPRLSDEAASAAVVKVQRDLTEARSRLDVGQLAALESALPKLLDDVKATGFRPLQAEARALEAALRQAQGKNADAAQAWQLALTLAQASGVDDLVALAAVRLATVVGFQLNRPAEGRAWLALAEATVERLGGDEVLTLERMGADARLFTAESRPLEAVPGHERALQFAKDTIGSDHPLVWKLEYDLGSSLVAARDNRRAVSHLERALALREREVSGDHPDSAMVRSTLANAYFFAGRPAESREAFERALAAREALFGVNSPKLVVTLNNFADTLLKGGEAAQALQRVERADTIARASFPVGHPYIAATTLTRAEIHLAQGRFDDVEAALVKLVAQTPPLPAPYLAEAGAVRSQAALGKKAVAAALAHAEAAEKVARAIGPKSSELILTLQAKGEALLEARRAKEAEAAFAEAGTVAEALQPWVVFVADAQVGLAKAQRAQGRSDEGVTALLEKAKATYEATPGAAAKATAVAALLAKRP